MSKNLSKKTGKPPPNQPNKKESTTKIPSGNQISSKNLDNKKKPSIIQKKNSVTKDQINNNSEIHIVSQEHISKNEDVLANKEPVDELDSIVKNMELTEQDEKFLAGLATKLEKLDVCIFSKINTKIKDYF